jgi:hypothetical protein
VAVSQPTDIVKVKAVPAVPANLAESDEKPQPDPLAVPECLRGLSAGELARRMQWVKRYLADNGHLPGPPGKPWAGQIPTAEAVRGSLCMAPEHADALVALTQAYLWEGSDDLSHVQKALMVEQLDEWIEAVRAEIKQGFYWEEKTTVVQDYLYDVAGNKVPQYETDAGTGLKRPRRIEIPDGRVKKPIDTASRWKVLLECQKRKAALLGLDGREESMTSATAELEEIEKLADGRRRKKTIRSVTQQVKAGQITSPAAREAMERVEKEAVEAKQRRADKNNAAQSRGEV